MKITCQSCQSKYNVADDKVTGKVVKIRCRKCGTTVVVDGTNASGDGAASARSGADESTGASQAGGDEWHVNVADNDQRTMSLAEVIDAYKTGVVTDDTFVWTDGMEDWKPVGEVEAILSAVRTGAADNLGAAQSASSGGPHENGDASGAVAAAALHASVHQPSSDAPDLAIHAHEPSAEPASAGATALAAAAAAAPSKAEPKRAAVVRREARARDLFASRADDGPGAFEMQASGAAFARASDDASRRTGERNENSVLFSLAVLTRSAEQHAPSSELGADEDSGLIDLKALAAKTEAMRPAAVADASVFAPPLGTIGPIAPPLGILGSPLGEGSTRRLPLIIGAIAGFALMLLAAGAVGARFFSGGPTDATGAPASASAAIAAPSASSDVEAPLASASAEPSASALAPATSASVATGLSPKPHPAGGGGAGVARPMGVTAKPAGGAAAAAGDNGAAPTPAPKKTNDCGCNGDLMCLMKCSTH